MQAHPNSIDLLFSSSLAGIITAVITLFPDWHSPLRIALALILVLIVPGYNLTTIFFPRYDDIDGVERFVLSAGLSIVVVAFLNFILTRTVWGIQLVPLSGALCLFVFITSAAAYLQRRQLKESSFYLPFPFLYQQGAAALGVSIASAAIIVLAYSLRPEEQLTEFYILGSEGRLEAYPTTLTVGETFSLTLGITNREGQTMSYRIHLPFDPEHTDVKIPAMAPGEQKEINLEFTSPGGLGKTKLPFELYRTTDTRPYRSLHLFVTLVSQ